MSELDQWFTSRATHAAALWHLPLATQEAAITPIPEDDLPLRVMSSVQNRLEDGDDRAA